MITKSDQLQDEFGFDTRLFFAEEMGIIKKQIFMDNNYSIYQRIAT
jgi:hypothetical protein